MAFSSPSPPRFRLNNGQEIPILGLGTWRSKQLDAFNIVLEAIDLGYRHIDTALVYNNEREIGEAIQRQIEDEKVTREELFIVTKLPNLHHDPLAVEFSCRKSLANLRLKYIDLYLMHTPISEKFREEFENDYEPDNVDYLDTWYAMERLVEIGLVKGIGVCNFNSQQIQRILDNCNIKPTVNQIECHPGFNQKNMINFCKKRHIDVIAYCPLGRPEPDKRLPIYIYSRIIRRLAAKYGRTPAQMCLRYLLQIGAYPIPKTSKPEHLAENYNIFDFIISKEDMEFMDTYNTKYRLLPFSKMKQHEYYPFNIPF